MKETLSSEPVTIATSHDLEARFILIECRDPLVRKRMAENIKALPKLLRIQEAAERLLSLVQAKGQPLDHPENQKLISAGDTIMVSEGNLWALLGELRS